MTERKNLRVARGFALPLSVAGEAIAILAKRGAGKTNTAVVLVEELLAAGVQTVVLDPVSAWWGLRWNADGDKAAHAVPILGGPHGDVPIEETAGALLADVAVESGQSLVLDLSDLPSKGAIGRFVVDFAERLYYRKGRSRSPLHLVMEEADVFAPQRIRSGDAHSARMQAAVESMVRRGRSRGIGVTLITQRSAVLSKDVLTQADVLIVMRTTGPQDIAAIREWVNSRGDERGREVLESLPGLATGEGWVWNPERDMLHRVRFRYRRTFDASKSPTGEEAEPTARSEIDVGVLGEQIAATAERAKENDPAELRRKIRELQRDLEKRPTEQIVKEVPVEIEVPVLDGQIPEVAEQLDRMSSVAGELRRMADDLTAKGSEIVHAIRDSKGERRVLTTPAQTDPAPRAADRTERAVARPPAAKPPPGGEAPKLKRAERAVLNALAQYDERTVRQVATLTGYAINGGGFRNALGALRTLGFIEGRDPVRITEAGLAAAGEVEALPTGRALLDHWLRPGKLKKAEREVLQVLWDAYPNELTADEIAERTPSRYEPSGGGFRNALGRLRTLELAEGHGLVRASPDLADA